MPETRVSGAPRLDLSPYPLATHLGRVFAERGFLLHLVGGSVRSLLLGLPAGDLDFTTPARPADITQRIRHAGGHPVPIGERFGTIAGVFAGHVTVEITTYRSEVYQPGSRKPEVQFGDSLAGDLGRRDFTINALAADALSGELFDLHGGERDLAARLIRAVGDPHGRFAEDPLRLMRAVRLAAQLDFRIEGATGEAVVQQSAALQTISHERIRDELTKLLVSERPSYGVRLLCDLGLMPFVLPEFLALRGMQQEGFHHKDVYEHTLQVLDGVPGEPGLRLAALLHDIAKPRTRSTEQGEVHFFGHERLGAKMARQRLADLRYPAEVIDRVVRLVELHGRTNAYESDWTDGAVRRWMREAGEALDDLLLLSWADVTTRREQRKAQARRRVEELRARIEAIRAAEDVSKLKSPLDGNDLMALFGRGPGPWIAPLKARLLDLVIDGELAQDDRETATHLAREWVQSMENGTS
jgi:poly(A) polymerase